MAEGFKVIKVSADHPDHIVTGIRTILLIIQETVNQPFVFSFEQIFCSVFWHSEVDRPCQVKLIQPVRGRADIPVVIV